MQCNHKRALALALTAALPGTLAAAEDSRATTVEEIIITGSHSTYLLDSSSSSTKLNLSMRETPQSLTIISQQLIEDFDLTSVAQVMQRTPGVNVYAQDTERVRFSARGFEIDNFLYDGIPSTRAGSLAGQTAHADPVIYERVEVLRGSSGLLNGTGNPSATINLVRKRPLETAQATVSAGADSWGSYRGEFDASSPLNGEGSVRGRLVGAYETGETYLDHYEKDKTMIYGVVEADLGPRTQLALGADLLDHNPEGSTWGALPLYYSDGSETDFDVSTNPATHWSSWAQDARTAFINLDHDFGNGWTARLYYTDEENSYDAQLSSAGSGFPDPQTGAGMSLWAGRYQEERSQRTVDAFLNGTVSLFGREHEIVVGASHSDGDSYYTGQSADPSYNTEVSSLFNWTGDRDKPAWAPINAVEDETIEQTGYYATGRFRPTDNLSLIAGSRLVSWDRHLQGESDWAGITDETYEESGQAVPYIGAVYDLNALHSVYASYTSIFKPQTVRDRDNDLLDPEEGNSYEIGFKSELFGDRVNTGVALFRIEQDNLAESTGERIIGGPPDSVAYRAVDGAVTEGVELQVVGEVLPGLQLMGGYTHRQTEDAAGTAINTQSPEDMLRLTGRYQFTGALRGLTLGGGLSWHGEISALVDRPGYSEQVRYTQSDYYLVDLMASYQFTERLSASLNAKNLLDEKYYNNLGFYNGGYYGNPRQYNLRFTYAFR